MTHWPYNPFNKVWSKSAEIYCCIGSGTNVACRISPRFVNSCRWPSNHHSKLGWILIKKMTKIHLEREREFIQGDIVLLQTHSDNTATVQQKFTK